MFTPLVKEGRKERMGVEDGRTDGRKEGCTGKEAKRSDRQRRKATKKNNCKERLVETKPNCVQCTDNNKKNALYVCLYVCYEVQHTGTIGQLFGTMGIVVHTYLEHSSRKSEVMSDAVMGDEVGFII